MFAVTFFAKTRKKVASSTKPLMQALGSELVRWLRSTNMCRLVFNCFSFLILLACLSGCSTIFTKTSDGYSEEGKTIKNVGLGKLYSGTQFNTNAIYCLVRELPSTLIVLLIAAPFLIVDLPLSLAADTLLVPADLGNETKEVRQRDRCYFHI